MLTRTLCAVLAASVAAPVMLPTPASGATSGATSGANRPSPPSAAQIRAAVRRAEKSPDLWATINICNKPSAHPIGDRVMGVRVQMPALGFAARLFMTVAVDYWDSTQKRFLKTDSHYGPTTFGVNTHRAQQGGVMFAFKPPPAGQTDLLRARATLEWRIGRHVLGRVVRSTGRGFKHVDFGDPPGYSAGTCTITP